MPGARDRGSAPAPQALTDQLSCAVRAAEGLWEDGLRCLGPGSLQTFVVNLLPISNPPRDVPCSDGYRLSVPSGLAHMRARVCMHMHMDVSVSLCTYL